MLQANYQPPRRVAFVPQPPLVHPPAPQPGPYAFDYPLPVGPQGRRQRRRHRHSRQITTVRPAEGSHAMPWPSNIDPYLNPPAAIGLPIPPQAARNPNPGYNTPYNTPWPPRRRTFHLAIFRCDARSTLTIEKRWDDERLLRELNRKYDELRSVWRKLFSLKGLKTIVVVHANVSPYHVYPQQVLPDPSLTKALRFRYYLRHPHLFAGRYDFVTYLAASPDLGVQFTEQWQAWRIAVVVLTAVASTLVTGVLYAHFKHDVSTAFTIAGYMAGALSVICILIGVLNFVEFK